MKNNYKKGFTLIELIISLSLLALVITMSYSVLLSTIRLPDKAVNEYDVQTAVRLLTQKVNGTIRDASATFALYRINHNNLTAGWNYIIPSVDRTRIIEYKWNKTLNMHVASEIVSPQSGVIFDLVFRKINPSYTDNLLEFDIVAIVNGQTREIKSEVEALNSLQVIDRGNSTNPANSLAYRLDPRPTEISTSQACVAMVLDRSGSMAWDLAGNTTGNIASSRLYKLKVEAKRLINSLAVDPNIFASIVPFSSTANDPTQMLKVRYNDDADPNPGLIGIIDQLTANGGTNTGDGLRRGYFEIKRFNDKPENSTKVIKNFMIVLVDGVTTFYSAHRVNATYYNYSGWNITGVEYFIGDNNIVNQQISEYNTTYENGRYNGYGSSLDPRGTTYVNEMGTMIRNYGSGVTADKEEIAVYVIGFSSKPSDHGSLGDIAMATTGNATFYIAGDETALQSIFAAIAKDIGDSLWHIGGPN